MDLRDVPLDRMETRWGSIVHQFLSRIQFGRLSGPVAGGQGQSLCD